MAKNDSILGVAARLKDAEQRASKTFDAWVLANTRMSGLLAREVFERQPGIVALDQAQLQATCTYEATLDAQREKHVLKVKFAEMKVAAESKRRPDAIPVRQVPIRTLDARTERYCVLRAQGLSPQASLIGAGFTAGVVTIEGLESDSRVVARINQLKNLRDGETT